MKRVLIAAVVAVLLLATSSAQAGTIHTWADSATVVSVTSGLTEYTSISLTEGQPDDSRWRVHTANPTDRDDIQTVVGTWGFSDDVAGDASFFAVFYSARGSGWMGARVISYATSSGTIPLSEPDVTIPIEIRNTNTTVPFVFTQPAASTVITAINVQFTFIGEANFRIDAIGASAPVSTIPLPSAAWAGLGLLGVLGAARRYRRRNAA